MNNPIIEPQKMSWLIPSNDSLTAFVFLFLTVISRDISDSSNNDLQNIMSELERLKSYLNQTELQLYEANEHISDLLEKASLER